MIHVEGLIKRYGDRTVIQGISFDLEKGQTAALVGPSGGGKSTLIRCLHGLETFEGGSISVGSVRLSPGKSKENTRALKEIRKMAGFVFQQWHLFAHMTALENVMEAPVHVRGDSKSEAEKNARALLEKVGMSHRADARPARLSGGEQQRIAIARALAMNPQILFMDEPTSALDPQRVLELVDLLRLLASEGLTLVSVTHDLRFATELCDRMLVFAGGEIVEDGVPKEIVKDPKDPRTRSFLGL